MMHRNRLHWRRAQWAMEHGPEYGVWYIRGYGTRRTGEREPDQLGYLQAEGWRDGAAHALRDDREPIITIR